VRDVTDCDDGSASTNPDATEVCDDEIDQDCSGVADDELSCGDCTELYGYLACGTTKSWSEAEDFCKSAVGTELARIDDDTENANAVEAIVDAFDSANVWIGANDMATEGTWLWADGSAVTYTHWASGEPGGSDIENCVAIRAASIDWYDSNCDAEMRFACDAP
jgi:hypothetical protein